MYRYDVTVDGSRALWLCDGDLRPTATIVLNSERLR
jgi:hypothetical protein